MRVGILHEGKLDREPIEILIKTIAHDAVNVLLSEFIFIPHAARGPLTAEAMNIAVTLFFELANPCDLAVFMTDCDRGTDRCRDIKVWVRAYAERSGLENIAVGCPDPEFEFWLLDEETAVKRFFGLPHDRALPHISASPKDRMKQIIGEHSRDLTKTTVDIYNDITGMLNLSALGRKNASFGEFQKELKKKIKAVNLS